MSSKVALLFGIAIISAQAEVTFNKDVAPILQQSCQKLPSARQYCADVPPYLQRRAPLGRSIKPKSSPQHAALVHGQERRHQSFKDDFRSPTIKSPTTAWVDAGSPEGNPPTYRRRSISRSR